MSLMSTDAINRNFYVHFLKRFTQCSTVQSHTHALGWDGIGCVGVSKCERLHWNTSSYQRSSSHPIPAQRASVNAPLLLHYETVYLKMFSQPRHGQYFIITEISFHFNIHTSRPSNPLSAFLLHPRFGFGWPLCACTNIHLLTYLLKQRTKYLVHQNKLRPTRTNGARLLDVWVITQPRIPKATGVWIC